MMFGDSYRFSPTITIGHCPFFSVCKVIANRSPSTRTRTLTHTLTLTLTHTRTLPLTPASLPAFSSQYYSGWFSGAETGASWSDHGYVIVEKIDDLQLTTLQEIRACGAQGRNGPSQADCEKYYTPTRDPAGWFDAVTDGVQRLVVPQTGYYRLTAYGAKGGDAYQGDVRYFAGLGATVTGTFFLKQNDAIRVVVGQHGQYRTTRGGSETMGGAGGGKWG